MKHLLDIFPRDHNIMTLKPKHAKKDEIVD